MTAPMSQDLRERIAHAVEAGSAARAAAERFAVSASAAIKLMQRVRQTGSTTPAKIGGHRRPILEPHADRGSSHNMEALRALCLVFGSPTTGGQTRPAAERSRESRRLGEVQHCCNLR